MPVRHRRLPKLSLWLALVLVTACSQTGQPPADDHSVSEGARATCVSPIPSQSLPQLPELRDLELPAWRTHISPDADELAYLAIDWVPDLAGGMVRAHEQQRPVFLWAMNGHPLGCT